MTSPTRRQRIGIALAGIFALSNVPSVLMPPPGDEVGPPLAVLALGSVLGVVGLLALVPAWRGSALAMRVLTGANVAAVLSALPAFFVDVPLGIKALVAVSLLWVVVSSALMFSVAERRPSAAVAT